jgi:CRISPR/Cas system-associated endoribonuclease Cas2
MKGDLTIKLLETVGEFSGFAADMVGAFLRAGYGASRSRMDFEFNKLRRRRESATAEKYEKSKYYKLLSKLKSQGFIMEKARDVGPGIFVLTSAGKRKLAKLKKRRAEMFPPKHYYKEKGGRFVIIIFDIPENERRKRAWLRSILAYLGLEMIQKSVWIGKVKIPKDFIADLTKLNIIDHVEILEVNKTGSLKQLT